MKSSVELGRKKAAVGVGAVLLLAASLVTVSATLSAQTTDCGGDQQVGFGTQYFGTGDYGNHLLSVAGQAGGTELAPVAVSLPAGTYDIDAVATDGYPGRDGVSQPYEQWIADFRDASGNVLATTSATGDVEDLTESGYWNGSIGTVELSADAVDVVIRHAFPGPGNSPNSVRAVCIGITGVNVLGAVVVDPCDDAAAGETVTDADGNAVECAAADSCTEDLAAAGVADADAAAACDADDCSAAASAAAPDADAAAIASACGEPVADDDVEPEVLGAVVTAPVAQAETGDPTFTG